MCGNWKVKLFVFSCKCVETGKLNCLFSLVNVWKDNNFEIRYACDLTKVIFSETHSFRIESDFSTFKLESQSGENVPV